MAVPVVMDVVLNLGCHGSTGGNHLQLQKILKFVLVKMKAMLPRILRLKHLSCIYCKLYDLSCLNIYCCKLSYIHPFELRMHLVYI